VEGQTRTVDLPASDDPAAFGPQDVVVCALKAQQAYASAGAFALRSSVRAPPFLQR
jgi:2-dehydropantoate 2-reductase